METNLYKDLSELSPRVSGFGYRAFLVDIDGTLLDHTDTITPRTKAALDRVQKLGIQVFLATGRSIYGALRIHEELGLPTPVICYNGLVVYEPSTQEWLRHKKIPDELVRELLQLAEKRSEFFFLFHDDKKFSLPYVNKVHSKMAETLKNVEQIPFRKMPESDITKLNLYCKPEGAELVRDFLGRSPDLQVDVFSLSVIPAFKNLDLMYLDVQPRHQGKAQALDFLQEEYGIPPSAVIAFGDQVNDRPMLRRAGLGVAMGNAPNSLKRDAVLVIDSNRKEGVAGFIDLMFPEET